MQDAVDAEGGDGCDGDGGGRRQVNVVWCCEVKFHEGTKDDALVIGPYRAIVVLTVGG